MNHTYTSNAENECVSVYICAHIETHSLFFLFFFIPSMQAPFVRTTIQFYGCVYLLFSNLLDDGFAGRLTSLNCISKWTKYCRTKDTYYKCNQIWVNIILVRLQLTRSYFEILNWCIYKRNNYCKTQFAADFMRVFSFFNWKWLNMILSILGTIFILYNFYAPRYGNIE